MANLSSWSMAVLAGAYAHEHIPDAISLPHREISAETTASFDRSKLYVCYCDGIGCMRSTKTALKLLTLGFQVRELIGGLDWWKRTATRPTCRKRGPDSRYRAAATRPRGLRLSPTRPRIFSRPNARSPGPLDRPGQAETATMHGISARRSMWSPALTSNGSSQNVRPFSSIPVRTPRTFRTRLYRWVVLPNPHLHIHLPSPQRGKVRVGRMRYSNT